MTPTPIITVDENYTAAGLCMSNWALDDAGAGIPDIGPDGPRRESDEWFEQATMLGVAEFARRLMEAAVTGATLGPPSPETDFPGPGGRIPFDFMGVVQTVSTSVGLPSELVTAYFGRLFVDVLAVPSYHAAFACLPEDVREDWARRWASYTALSWWYGWYPELWNKSAQAVFDLSAGDRLFGRAIGLALDSIVHGSQELLANPPPGFIAGRAHDNIRLPVRSRAVATFVGRRLTSTAVFLHELDDLLATTALAESAKQSIREYAAGIAMFDVTGLSSCTDHSALGDDSLRFGRLAQMTDAETADATGLMDYVGVRRRRMAAEGGAGIDLSGLSLDSEAPEVASEDNDRESSCLDDAAHVDVQAFVALCAEDAHLAPGKAPIDGDVGHTDEHDAAAPAVVEDQGLDGRAADGCDGASEGPAHRLDAGDRGGVAEVEPPSPCLADVISPDGEHGVIISDAAMEQPAIGGGAVTGQSDISSPTPAISDQPEPVEDRAPPPALAARHAPLRLPDRMVGRTARAPLDVAQEPALPRRHTTAAAFYVTDEEEVDRRIRTPIITDEIQ